jgi:C4-dicarboxylate-specific signal transduction histidine kinase
MRRFLRPTSPLRQPASLASLVHDVCELCRAGSAINSLDIHVEIPDNLPDVFVDSIQVQQVLMNLIQNSLQAMQAAGRHVGQCRVRARVDGPQCRVDVHDDGPGFPTDIDPSDLTPFCTSKPQGLGMGLAISRSIVEQHGGRLWAAIVDGPGATVSFTLPLALGPQEEIKHAADGVCR